MISARPPESRSSVANCWKTRIGSSELSTVTALVSRMRSVRAAPAASTTTGRADRVVVAMVLADAEDVQPDAVGQLDLLDQLREPALRCDARAQVAERVDAELHRPDTLMQLRAQPSAQLGETHVLVHDDHGEDRGEHPERRERRDGQRDRQKRDGDDRRDQPLPAEAMHVAPAERHVGH